MVQIVRITVDVHKDEALVTFDQAYSWISLPPKMAREVAAALIAVADKIESYATDSKKV